MSQSFRLSSGGLIDRSCMLQAQFDGRALTGTMRTEAAWDELRLRLSDAGVRWAVSWTPRALQRRLIGDLRSCPIRELARLGESRHVLRALDLPRHPEQAFGGAPEHA